MKECTLFHTGLSVSAPGVIKDNRVYMLGVKDKLYLPEYMYLAEDECDNGLIQLMVDGKWGFADIYTGEIVIEPAWDYLGPFYGRYAHAALGAVVEISPGDFPEVDVRGGIHGYLDPDGEIVIPIEYDCAEDIPYCKKEYFLVIKDGKYGFVDKDNKVVFPFQWDFIDRWAGDNLIFCAVKKSYEILNKDQKPVTKTRLKWSVYDGDFNLLIEGELDRRPTPYFKEYIYDSDVSASMFTGYYILNKDDRYGIVSKDGQLVSDIELSKDEVYALAETLPDFFDE